MSTTQDWSSFESFTAEIMQREHIAGAAVGVSRHGETIYARGFGVRDIASGAPVTPQTVFGIASVSKSFAALAIMQLVDEGRIDPLAPVTRYLPEFTLPRVADVQSIMVHHCLSHTTGLPPLKRSQGEFSEFGQHLAYLAAYETEMLGYPGQYLSYCNDAFLLSGAMVERLTGSSFQDRVQERILKPLAMSRTTYHLAALRRWDDVTALYTLDSTKTILEAQPWPDLGTYHVGGGIRSTVPDLLRYGDMYCAQGLAPDGRRVVSEAGVLRMRQPVCPTDPGSYYGYGLQVTPAYHGVTLVEHGGSLPGVSSRWGYIPELGLSMVVLTNVRGVPADLIWSGLANTALGLQPHAQRAKPAPTFPVPPEQLARLIGTYAADEGARVEVSLDKGRLVAETDGQTYPLRLTSPETAVYETQGQEKQVRWYLEAEGPAWAIKSGLRMVRRQG